MAVIKPPSQNAIDLIVKWECGGANMVKKFLKAYKCPAGIWTIGIGTIKINGRNVICTDTITEYEAYKYLKEYLEKTLLLLKDSIKVDLNQNQTDAVYCLVYNIGIGNFRKSPVLDRINMGDFVFAADCFLKHNKSGGKILIGLTNRRKEERELFLKPV